MNALIGSLPPDFVWQVLGGIAVNLRIAVLALVGGFLLGIPLALAQVRQGLLGRLAGALVALMRASPTFVVMFFLLNIIPSEISFFSVRIPVGCTDRRRFLAAVLRLLHRREWAGRVA